MFAVQLVRSFLFSRMVAVVVVPSVFCCSFCPLLVVVGEGVPRVCAKLAAEVLLAFSGSPTTSCLFHIPQLSRPLPSLPYLVAFTSAQRALRLFYVHLGFRRAKCLELALLGQRNFVRLGDDCRPLLRKFCRQGWRHSRSSGCLWNWSAMNEFFPTSLVLLYRKLLTTQIIAMS